MWGHVVGVVNVVGAAAIALVFFLNRSDRSWSAAAEWALFYTVSVAIPVWWAWRTNRALDRLAVPVPRELRAAALYPVLAGVMTLLAAIALLRDSPGG